MKQLIEGITKRDVEILSPDIDENPEYYAWERDSSKGFIARSSYDVGYFVPYCSEKLTNGNQYSQHKGKTLHKIIEKLLQSGFKVYSFGTVHEMYEYLSKPCE